MATKWHSRLDGSQAPDFGKPEILLEDTCPGRWLLVDLVTGVCLLPQISGESAEQLPSDSDLEMAKDIAEAQLDGSPFGDLPDLEQAT